MVEFAESADKQAELDESRQEAAFRRGRWTSPLKESSPIIVRQPRFVSHS